MHYYLEYGGGLGDLFYQMYEGNSYSLLDELKVDDRATVTLITHNPYARELFDFHPKARQFEVKDIGYWMPEQDREMRKRYGLPQRKPSLPVSHRAVQFYAAPGDLPILKWLEGKAYLLFSVSAGLRERDFPEELVEALLNLAQANALLSVFVGRNYARFDRQEFRPQRGNTLDTIDRLTVPGVARVVQNALGVICCHSAINMLAWLLRKPQLLLYPQSVYERHIAGRDRWAFGIDYPECHHARFDGADRKQKVEAFFSRLQSLRPSQTRSQDLTSVRKKEAKMGIETFPDFVRQTIAEAEPMSQNSSLDNLGFGWIYYALIRNLRPDYVVAIGSAQGFMPFCAARALQDNDAGKLIFIDPSYSGNGHPGWGGRGLWSDPQEVQSRIAHFGLAGWMSHLKMTSEEAFPVVKDIIGPANLGVVIIDGAHTYEHSLQDFDLYAGLMKEGFAVFHDATTGDCEVWRTIHTLRTRGYPMITFYREVGLTVVEIRKPPAVQETWQYLCNESNRAALLFEHARKIIPPGSRVFDVYCGFSPMAALLNETVIFGCDCDPAIINQLRRLFPQHRWQQIDEMYLPFAELPDEIDVLMGLGLSRGYASWDPQRVVDNLRYLLGRYFPRACFFETAAEYHNGEILDDIRGCLERLGYHCKGEVIETNMSAFHRRRLLIAER